ncbi:MAG: ABC transporter ATP-binding protein [Polyangiaceae bacterium]
MISARNLTKSFGSRKIVDDVSFEAKEGEFVALLGPSGGGKSTVLRVVAGLEPPDRGSVWIGGRDVTNTRAQERGLGFVFQHYALFKHMTVRQNIAFGLEVRGAPKAEITERVRELLALVQLEGLDERFPSQLSGGQRQRVALARALAPRPVILLLDEPFGALDAKVRLELRTWLSRIQRAEKMTCVFVTHDQDEALELADRVVIIHRGRVEQVGSAGEVYDKPATPFVASFIGATNVLEAKVRQGRAAVGDLSLSTPEHAPEGSDVRAFVRHHHIEVVRKDDGAAAPGLTRAVVRRLSRVGWVVRLELETSAGPSLKAEVPRDRIESLAVNEGDAVWLSLKDAAVFVEDFVI